MDNYPLPWRVEEDDDAASSPFSWAIYDARGEFVAFADSREVAEQIINAAAELAELRRVVMRLRDAAAQLANHRSCKTKRTRSQADWSRVHSAIDALDSLLPPAKEAHDER